MGRTGAWASDSAADALCPVPSLAEDLALLLPGEPDALIDADARARLHAVAATMAPVDWIALEYRLAAGAGQVDIQQCFRREAGDFAVLAGHFARLAGELPEVAALARLRAFAAVVPAGIEELFLEYDVPATSAASPVPGVFLSLPDAPAAALATLFDAAERLRGAALPDAVAAAIARCFDAARGDGFVAHAGLMLNRPLDVVRINVKGLRCTTIAAFLRDCGWPGDIAAAEATFGRAAGADRVTVALDIGAAPLPRIGFEAFFDDQPGMDDRWRILLDALAAEGLAAPDKAAAFRRVPGNLLPAQAQRWPMRHLRASLVGDPARFSAFARRASHLKLTLGPGAHCEAKAYSGAGHLWLKPGQGEAWQPTLARPRARRSVGASGVDGIAGGIAFLRNAQQQSGLWRDFRIGDAIGDEWVSAFVATQLAGTGDADARAAAAECRQALATTRRAEGGWGYSRDYPADADSTAWALRLAAALGEADPRAQAFLERHRCPGGGITTYAEQAALAQRIGVAPGASFAGWRQPHGCVTAAAAPFLPEARAWLRSARQDRGWSSYWWDHDAYATGLAVEQLAGEHLEGTAAAVQVVEAWLAGPAEALTAFDLAWSLRALVAAGVDGTATAERLRALQQADGGWPAGARLRVPMPGAVHAGAASTHHVIDQRRNFTTAAAVGALARWQAA